MPRCAISSCTPTACSIHRPGCITTSRQVSGSLRRLIGTHFRPHWRWFVGGSLCALITSIAAVSYGGLIKLLGDQLQASLDAGSPGGAPGASLGGSTLGWSVLPSLIILAALVRALSLYGMTLANNIGVQRALVDVSNAQYAALVEGDYGRLSQSASGGYVSRFIHDLNSLRDFGMRLSNNLTKSVLTVTGALLGMLWMDWQLALILLVAYPIAFGPVVALGNRIRQRSKQAQEQSGDVTSFLSEGFQAGRAVKAYGLEAYQKERAAKGFQERARLYLKILADKAAVDPILEVAGGFAIAGVLAFSAWRISVGASTIGDFLGFIALIGVAAPELRALGGLSAVAQEARSATERFHDLVDTHPRVVDASDPVPLQEIKGAIAFKHVHFAYETGKPALVGMDFQIAAGETVAIVGPSGAGKSTLFNLMLRLYDPGAGVIELDGKDLCSLRKADLRAAMALVEQDPVLFEDTVRANIAMGRPGAREDEIVAAARLAEADGFIRELDAGYDTPVGERGNRLSGGQKQRIALARAILRDAPILLLDEATSALDAASEAAVQDALKAFSKPRTLMIIAHRLATVKWADRILVLDQGQVVETGTHDDLLASGGLYARLVGEQLV